MLLENGTRQGWSLKHRVLSVRQGETLGLTPRLPPPLTSKPTWGQTYVGFKTFSFLMSLHFPEFIFSPLLVFWHNSFWEILAELRGWRHLSILPLWVGKKPKPRGQVWDSGAKPVGRPGKSVVGLGWVEGWKSHGGIPSEVSHDHRPFA